MDHPDVMEFIKAKLDEGVLRNFNVSVGITDAFMEALKKDKEYALIHPGTREVTRKLKAKDVFDTIGESAWASGDPGLLFLDTINKEHPLSNLGEIEAIHVGNCLYYLMKVAIWLPLTYPIWLRKRAAIPGYDEKDLIKQFIKQSDFWITL